MPVDTPATLSDIPSTVRVKPAQKQVEVLSQNLTECAVGEIRAAAGKILDGADNATITKQSLEVLKMDCFIPKLEAQFGKGIILESCHLTPKQIEKVKHEVFILRNKETKKVLAYINQNGEVLVNMKTFKPFSNNINEGLMKKTGLEVIYNGEIWQLIYKGEIYNEGTEKFNNFVIMTHIM
ncbi:MAG: hypothetical protein N4A38_03890 [Candidatus Gracilibacteria bacterium]|nr:hypothetical protein [Candidatus Gracilibacteria bacterium]